MRHDNCQTVFAKLPGFFERYGPHFLIGKTNIPFCYAYGEDGKMIHWEVLAKRGKGYEKQFGFAIQAMINYVWPYTGSCDLSWAEEYASKNSERLLIYLGIPPSRCTVEDRAAMIPSIHQELSKDHVMKDVQIFAADFHKEQPAQGKRITHDYDDDDYVNLLKNLAYSLPDDELRARILINDQIMTDPLYPWVAAMDIIMLTWASKERSKQQFADLAQRAGLV
ncbi:hypothetical protein GGR53DRAFT_530388 [Hypoxylon sp. FL1150]|nr:hypothetical protein GGR53DRAFT_530388 [Hypoxylon sp. FL1150]